MHAATINLSKYATKNTNAPLRSHVHMYNPRCLEILHISHYVIGGNPLEVEAKVVELLESGHGGRKQDDASPG